jgi:hypothetical protein
VRDQAHAGQRPGGQIDIAAVGGTGGYISPLAGPVSGLPIPLPSSIIPGGAAGRVNARLQVQPGQILYIAVGGNGSEGETFNGGGAPGTMCMASLPGFPTLPCYLFLASPLYYGKAGGGASDIRTVSRTQPNSLASRLVVAGGGGGAGGFGAGGAAEQAALPDGQGGKAGTATEGGAGGAGEPASANYPVAGLPGADGVFGSGGKGVDDQLCTPTGGRRRWRGEQCNGREWLELQIRDIERRWRRRLQLCGAKRDQYRGRVGHDGDAQYHHQLHLGY